MQHLLQLAWPHPVGHPKAKPSPDRLACCSQTPARAEDGPEPVSWCCVRNCRRKTKQRKTCANLRWLQPAALAEHRLLKQTARLRSIGPLQSAATCSAPAKYQPLTGHIERAKASALPACQHAYRASAQASCPEHRPWQIGCHLQQAAGIGPA